MLVYDTPLRTVGGFDAAKLAKIQTIFNKQVSEEKVSGAQLVVARFGQVALDLYAGWVDSRRNLPVTADTRFLTFSVTKAFTAFAIHQILERLKRSIDEPIAHFWQEFGCNGKHAATIRHALTHQAGVPGANLKHMLSQIPLWQNWERITQHVAKLACEYQPGQKVAYHVVNYGFILGEVLRRLSQIPIAEYLRRYVFEPLGMCHSQLGGDPAWQKSDFAPVQAGSVERLFTCGLFNQPAVRQSVLPATTLYSTARDLAQFYQMLVSGGQAASQQFVSTETLARATAPQYAGIDHTTGWDMHWAAGFQLGGKISAKRLPVMGDDSSARTFGYFGVGTCMAWADWDAQLVVAYTSNRMLGDQAALQRWRTLNNAIWQALV